MHFKIEKRIRNPPSSLVCSTTDFEDILKYELSNGPYLSIHNQPLFATIPSTSFQKVFDSVVDLFGIERFQVLQSSNPIFQQDHEIRTFLTPDQFINENRVAFRYIAQNQIYQRFSKNSFYNFSGDFKAIEKANEANQTKLKSQVNLPVSLDSKFDKLKSVNLWINVKGVTADWHFDLYENYLTVLAGSKTVFLLNPKFIDQGILRAGVNLESYLQDNSQLKSQVVVFSLTPNKILKIPEGWFHKVVSSKRTIGLNFWFENSFEKVKETIPFLMKQQFENWMEEEWKDKHQTLFRDRTSEIKIRKMIHKKLKSKISEKDFIDCRKLLHLLDNFNDVHLVENNHESEINKNHFYNRLYKQKSPNDFIKLEEKYEQHLKTEKKKLIWKHLNE